MIRNPIDCAYSAYNMDHQWLYAKGEEYKWFMLDKRRIWDLKDFTVRDYFQHLVQFEDKEQILVIESSELRKNKKETLKKVESFLGLKSIDWEAINLEDQNQRTYNEKLPDTLRARLRAFYAPHNERLFDLLARRFDWK